MVYSWDNQVFGRKKNLFLQMNGEQREGRLGEVKKGEIYLYMPLISFLLVSSGIFEFSVVLQIKPENISEVWEGSYRMKTRLLLLCRISLRCCVFYVRNTALNYG